MDKVELRRKRLINFAYLALLLGLVYLFVKYAFWIFFPFMFAFFVALIVQKPSNSIVKKLKIKKGIVTTVLVLLLMLLIISLLSLVGMRIVDAGKGLVEFVRDKLSDFPTLIENVRDRALDLINKLPASISVKLSASATNFFDMIRDKSASEVAGLIVNSASGSGKFSISSLSNPLSSVWSTAKQIPSVFVAVIITILSSCFMASDYDVLVGFIKNQLSEEHKIKLSKAKRVFVTSVGKLLKSYATIICITGVELFIGLNILSLAKIYTGGNILAISIIVAFLDILPVIGTGTFMVPWSIYSFITGKIALGIGLFVVYAIIYVVRQIIEPKIIGGTVGLPSFLTLMGMYVGSQIFGIIGIFLMPMLLITVKLFNDEGVIHLWTPAKKANIEATETAEEDKQSEPKKKSLLKRLRKK